MNPESYFNQFLSDHPSCLILTREDFLRREINLFPLNLPLVLRGAKRDCLEKWERIFGKDATLDVSGNPVPFDAFEEGDIYRIGSDFRARTRLNFGDLAEIIRRLRDPDGCAWDRAQTHESIREDLLEECYELLEGIDEGNPIKMREESGDVILQGVFHAIIAESEGSFTLEDVVSDLAYKLVFRHPHVFGALYAADAEGALNAWEGAKSKEKGFHSIDDKLAKVPKTFPPLMRAQKIQKIVRKAGYDMPSAESAKEKIYEELEEFRAAEGEAKVLEGGDLIFSVVNYLRLCGVDAPVALTAATEKFLKRFYACEAIAAERGKQMKEMDEEELFEVYEIVKQREKRA